LDVLEDLDYDTEMIDRRLREMIASSAALSGKEKERLLEKLYLYLSENSYLKTIQSIHES